MRNNTNYYTADTLNDIDLDGFVPANLGWAIADRFPTEEYLAEKERIDSASGPYEDLATWQEDEDYREFVDWAAYGKAPVVFTLTFDDGLAADDDDISEVCITLHAATQPDAEYLKGIMDETYDSRIKYLHGVNPTVFVLTYNTADKPERRIVNGVFTTKDLAMDRLAMLQKQFGDFMVNHEIDEKPLVGPLD